MAYSTATVFVHRGYRSDEVTGLWFFALILVKLQRPNVLVNARCDPAVSCGLTATDKTEWSGNSRREMRRKGAGLL
jgi:hypothetical protein